MEPKVLLLDEPLSAIDAKLRRELQEKIKNVQKKLKITTIFVTHDQDEAMIMSDRIHLMNQGIIEQSGKPVDLYTHPVSKFAAEFIGHYNILDKSKLNILLPLEKFDDGFYAIRPETVQIQGEPIMDNGMYTFEAVVENFISREMYCVIHYVVEMSSLLQRYCSEVLPCLKKGKKYM